MVGLGVGDASNLDPDPGVEFTDDGPDGTDGQAGVEQFVQAVGQLVLVQGLEEVFGMASQVVNGLIQQVGEPKADGIEAFRAIAPPL